jgi:hypothetical protein
MGGSILPLFTGIGLTVFLIIVYGIITWRLEMDEKKTMTWEDIENTFAKLNNNPIETDPDKLEYFKEKLLGHLDNIQKKEEDKKIIPFPNQRK